MVIWVTFITLLVAPGHAPITLSESYWSEDACLARLPDMTVLLHATVQGSGAQILDGAACLPVPD